MKNKWKGIGLIFIILLGALLLAVGLFIWGTTLGYVTVGQKVAIWLQGMLLLLGLLLTPIIITNSRKIWAKDKANRESLNPIETKKLEQPLPFTEFLDIKKHCRYRLGLLWRYKIRKCLVLGAPSEVESLFPRLRQELWQLNDRTLMIYGGDFQDEINTSWLQILKKHLSRSLPFFHKPIDGIIWAVPKHYLDNTRQQQLLVEKVITQLQSRDKILRWSAPLYLVAGQESEWEQTGRTEQSVGVIFPILKRNNIESVDLPLNQLAKECCSRGIQQVKENSHYAFLLKLSQNLAKSDIANIKRYLASLIAYPYSPTVRGIFFMPYQSLSNEDPQYYENYLTMTPTWQTISDDAHLQSGRRIGMPWGTLSCFTLFVGMVILGGTLLTSYFRNEALIEDSLELVKRADRSISKDYVTQLQTQYQLQQRLEQLLYRKQHGTPLLYQFGLNHNDALLDKLWSSYYTANLRNIAIPLKNIMVDNLTVLNVLTQMSPDDEQREKFIAPAYDTLKAYLMLSHPNRSDGKYLSKYALERWKAPEGISDGDWQRLMPDLVRFWGQMLKLHPDWAEQNDAQLVKDVRKLLIDKIGVQNVTNTIYQEIIQKINQQYPNQNLTQLLEGLDSHLLFFNDVDVPGVYTRKAWENSIKDEIDEASKTQREQIDWVLGDVDSKSTALISPEMLKQQLTERYFNEYGAAWLHFLNTIQWHQSNNVSDVIEQLTLLADTRQSPLVALLNVIKYQSEVAYTGDGLSDNLIRSAKELIENKSKNGIHKNNEASGPLTATFSPVTSLLKDDNTNGLSLQTYLMRVTQVRLKLQNIANSADPQTMMQGLAKSVFRGNSVDLTETRDYGNLIAANLGREWSGFSYSLFQQPIEQSWQVVLAPAADSFNDVWQNYIVSQWETSFAGRYPFKDTDNEASLPELARFLRPDTGIIDRFIIDELSGVLEKKGGNWIINTVNAQGLNFSPDFIEALKLFNDISTELLQSGDVSVSFDLMPRTGSKVTRSELIINKQKLEYFNQAPTWERINWPGEGYSTYSQLSWSSDISGLRLYEYYSGDWAWIRLLESASVKPLDSSRFELVWKAQDKSKLRYILRTQLGSGPLTLLKLRNFTLPQKVFE